jgi:hypothetical protein
LLLLRSVPSGVWRCKFIVKTFRVFIKSASGSDGWLSSNFTFSGFTVAHGISGLVPEICVGRESPAEHMIMASCLYCSSRASKASRLRAPTTRTAAAGTSSFTFNPLKVSANLGRRACSELGHRRPWLRFRQLPGRNLASIPK